MYYFVGLNAYILTYINDNGKKVTVARRSELKYSSYAKSLPHNIYRLRKYQNIGKALINSQ
jgi:hypothetical protein